MIHLYSILGGKELKSVSTTSKPCTFIAKEKYIYCSGNSNIAKCESKT